MFAQPSLPKRRDFVISAGEMNTVYPALIKMGWKTQDTNSLDVLRQEGYDPYKQLALGFSRENKDLADLEKKLLEKQKAVYKRLDLVISTREADERENRAFLLIVAAILSSCLLSFLVIMLPSINSLLAMIGNFGVLLVGIWAALLITIGFSFRLLYKKWYPTGSIESRLRNGVKSWKQGTFSGQKDLSAEIQSLIVEITKMTDAKKSDIQIYILYLLIELMDTDTKNIVFFDDQQVFTLERNQDQLELTLVK